MAPGPNVCRGFHILGRHALAGRRCGPCSGCPCQGILIRHAEVRILPPQAGSPVSKSVGGPSRPRDEIGRLRASPDAVSRGTSGRLARRVGAKARDRDAATLQQGGHSGNSFRRLGGFSYPLWIAFRTQVRHLPRSGLIGSPPIKERPLFAPLRRGALFGAPAKKPRLSRGFSCPLEADPS